MAGAFLSLVLDLCGPTLTLNHGEGGSAKDPKTMGPTAPDIFTSNLAEAALLLERGHFCPEPAGSSSLTRAIVGRGAAWPQKRAEYSSGHHGRKSRAEGELGTRIRPAGVSDMQTRGETGMQPGGLSARNRQGAAGTGPTGSLGHCRLGSRTPVLGLLPVG